MSVLRNRNFAILLSGQLISAIGNNLYLIALPWYVYSLTGSKADLAVTAFVQALPALAGMFVGVFVDRWRKRQTMIGADAARALICAALYAVVHWHPPFALFLGAVLLLEFAGTLFAPAETALLPLVLPKNKLPDALGMSQSVVAGARLVGMMAGGALMALLGAPLLFLLNGISFAGSLGSLFFVRVREAVQPSAGRQSFSREWLAGTRMILASRTILRYVLAAMAANFALAPADIMLVAWVKGPMRGTGLQLGLINAALMAGAMVGGLLVAPISKRWPLQRLVLVGFVALGAAIACVGIAPSAVLAAAMGFAAGASSSLMNGGIGAKLLQMIPEEYRGRIMGTLRSTSMLAIPIGIAVYGALLVVLPLRVMFLLAGVPTILVGLTFLVRSDDDFRLGDDGTMPAASGPASAAEA